ncbi:uncharacterized protein C8A04DRAFT_27649 [Dichotomopilus funicola]|uniref:Uncharacterized protein n=1 Tax=Dichotomopilus funicola TaxID=1934379 RepID=A0AAN6ZMG5_9PEZI|nr:hypothetical protein C8A04DRAFT_27649 [Dichotomopilus funicola]
MPALTVDTKAPTAPAATTANPPRASTSSRAASPSRPDVSPITPTQESAQLPQPDDGAGAGHGSSMTTQDSIPDFARGRPHFTHTTQTDQVGFVPPAAPPIDFDSNPDVLALKSAISILQLQRARAAADIQSLSRIRDAALANPEAFTADLAAGKVRVEGDPLFTGSRASRGAAADDDSDSSDDDSDSGSEGNEHEKEDGSGNGIGGDNTRQQATPESEPKASTSNTADGEDTPMPAAPGTSSSTTQPNRKTKQQNPNDSSHSPSTTAPTPPVWRQPLPKPQNIVRAPPINWAQYGIVGESLDKLHAEQLAAPTPGAPMTLGQGGAFEFRAGGNQNQVPNQASASPGTTPGGGGTRGGGETTRGEQPSPPRRLVGVASPYNPLRDKLDKKGKGGKR